VRSCQIHTDLVVSLSVNSQKYSKTATRNCLQPFLFEQQPNTSLNLSEHHPLTLWLSSATIFIKRSLHCCANSLQFLRTRFARRAFPNSAALTSPSRCIRVLPSFNKVLSQRSSTGRLSLSFLPVDTCRQTRTPCQQSTSPLSRTCTLQQTLPGWSRL
jgi:hypothetical protein